MVAPMVVLLMLLCVPAALAVALLWVRLAPQRQRGAEAGSAQLPDAWVDSIRGGL